MPALPPESSEPPSVLPSARWQAAGKFLADGEGSPVWLNGVSYGPFAPGPDGEPWPARERLNADLDHIQSLGFNTLRIYEPPSEALLAGVAERGLKLIVGITWTDHIDFLREGAQIEEALECVREQAGKAGAHPSVVAVLVGNEIEKTLVRWMGPMKVQRFLERMIEEARGVLPPEVLCGYATYPSTEYLMPRTADFFAANLYLETEQALRSYLPRLQNLAGNKPLLITEFGLDTASKSEPQQAETARWFREAALDAGVAGAVWFSYTDEWFRGGQLVEDWRFGLVDAERTPRPVCRDWSTLPTALSPDAGLPAISVVVCTRNGSATLEACLESLRHLNYPDYEVIVVDDGSTDAVPEIAGRFPEWRSIRQDPAGLSAARNRGLREAKGEILAYTDDDCRAHPDWLLHLGRRFREDPSAVAVGGPNIPPPPRNGMEAIVAAAPGAPAHVLLNDGEAEHLPGCNLAIRKEALEAIGGFHEDFVTAGDDVDVCWRLREKGGKLRYTAAAMVWHHRRFTAQAYWRQQRGYGRAEALLMKHHPGRFGPLGGARWGGSIYGDRLPTFDPVEGNVFFGPLGEGLFQGIYRSSSRYWVEWLSGVLWIALLGLSLVLGAFGVALVLLLAALGAARIRMRRLPPAPFALGRGDRLRLFGLCLGQPIVREWARLTGMIRLGARPKRQTRTTEVEQPRPPKKWTLCLGELTFWSTRNRDRHDLLKALQKRLAQLRVPMKWDDGWRRFDAEMHPSGELSQAVLTVTEYHGGGKCLTRARILMRVRTSLFFALLFFLALVIGFVVRSGGPMLTIGLGGVLAAILTAIAVPRLARRRVEGWLHASAKEGELQEVE